MVQDWESGGVPGGGGRRQAAGGRRCRRRAPTCGGPLLGVYNAPNLPFCPLCKLLGGRSDHCIYYSWTGLFSASPASSLHSSRPVLAARPPAKMRAPASMAVQQLVPAAVEIAAQLAGTCNPGADRQADMEDIKDLAAKIDTARQVRRPTAPPPAARLFLHCRQLFSRVCLGAPTGFLPTCAHSAPCPERIR